MVWFFIYSRWGGLEFQHLEIGIIATSSSLLSTLIQSMTSVGSKKNTTRIASMLLLQQLQTSFPTKERYIYWGKKRSSLCILFVGLLWEISSHSFFLRLWSDQRKWPRETACEKTEEKVWWCCETSRWRSLQDPTWTSPSEI